MISFYRRPFTRLVKDPPAEVLPVLGYRGGELLVGSVTTSMDLIGVDAQARSGGDR